MAVRASEPSTVLSAIASALILAFAPPTFAEEVAAAPGEESDALLSVDSPIGPFAYTLGRGLRVGDTGLHVGGFTTVEFDREEDSPGELALDGINFLVLFEPNEYVRVFGEIEVGDLFVWETDRSSVESDPEVVVERLYGDLRFGDPLNLRAGTFQTPVGRWNLVPAEPFVWTPEEPAFIEVAFDEHTTGGAVLGSWSLPGARLDYWLYGQFIDPIDEADDPAPADHSVGGRLQYDRFGGPREWSLGASFLATEIDGEWSHLGAVDAEVRWERLLLTSELTFQQGRLEDRDLWDVYVQGVLEVVPTFNLVARYEHIDPSGRAEDAHVGDVGVAWIPRPFLHLKAMYRFTDKQTEVVRRSLFMSFSFVF